MHLYLPGPQGPEQLATQWLLKQRGYTVVSATEVASPNYRHNAGMRPSARHFAQQQMLAMIEADAIVLHDELGTADALRLLAMARFAGVRALLAEELPATCPPRERDMELLDTMDLCGRDVERGPSLRDRAKEVVQQVRVLADRFDARFGWFFTNGNKQHRLPVAKPRPYPVRTSVTTTA